MTKKKSGAFTPEGIETLAKDKPVVYEILNAQGENIYTGSAKKGRVGPRLDEHLPGGKDAVPGGKKVVIQQKATIDEARASEARIIKRSQPKHNKKGK